jgi:hypothetical protein
MVLQNGKIEKGPIGMLLDFLIIFLGFCFGFTVLLLLLYAAFKDFLD